MNRITRSLLLSVSTMLVSTLCMAACKPVQPAEAIKLLDAFKEKYKNVPGIHQKINRYKFHYLRQLPTFQPAPCTAIQVPSSSAVVLKNCEKKGKEVLINQCSFDKAPNGIIIDRPGRYRLIQNINFSPTKPFVQAITITASDVVLDLDIYTIQQVNTQLGVYGVAIARDVHNVKVTGSAEIAQIRDFSLAGIRVMGRTDQITIENVTVTHTVPVVLTNDLIPADCADIGCALITGGIYVGEGEPSGLAFFGTDKNNLVTNLVLNRVNAKRCIFGGQIVMTFGLQIENCSFVENTNQGLVLGFFYPIPGDQPDTFQFPTASSGVIRNSHFDRNVGNNIGVTNPIQAPQYSTMSGIVLNEVQNIVVENCTVNDNVDTATLLAANHDGAHNITWRNCTFNSNISSFFLNGLHFSGSIPNSAGICVGIGEQPLNQNFNIVVEGCTASDNQVIPFNNQAFEIEADGMAFFFVDGARVSDCNASGNFGDGGALVGGTGFMLTGEVPGGQNNGITFLRCTAEKNQNTGSAANGTGFWIRANSANVIFRDCIANDNGQSNANLSMISSGFQISTAFFMEDPTSIVQNVIFDNCIVNSNGTPEQAAVSNAAGGIFINPQTFIAGAQNILVQDCTLTNNVNGLFVAVDIPGLIIKRNEADQNFLAGFDLTAQTSPVFFAKNIAYNNGSAPLFNNYPGVNPAIIISGTTVSLPTNVGFNNVSITS